MFEENTQWGQFPHNYVYQGDCGEAWERIGPASWRMKWKGDVEILAEIAFRRFGPHLDHVSGATAIRVGDSVEVTLCFRS